MHPKIDRRSFLAGSAVLASGVGIVVGDEVLDRPSVAAPLRTTPDTHAALTSLDIASSLGTGIGSTGIFAPSDWGQLGGWNAARAAAQSRRVNVVSFGDSIAQGFYSSSFATNGFFNKLVLALQNQYGDGGSGACSVINTNGLIPGSAGNITASGSGGNAVGGFDAFAIGLNGYALYPNTPGSGAALTFTGIRGTTVQVVNYPTGYAGTMTVSVDGGAPTTISGSTGGSAVAMGVTNIAATAGVHIVVVTFNSGTAILADVRGLNNDGIVGYGMNHYGRSSGDVRTTTYLSSTPLMGNICIEAFAPDLFIFEEGINDIGYDVLGITYAYNVACAMDFARAGNPLCDIVIVAPHRGNTPDLAELYPAYIGELRAVAESYGAMLVDFWPIGRNSYPFWSSLGYFGDGTNDGLAGSNPVHPSDAGHAFMESVLTPLLT